MDNIEVGEYVRTESGIIEKIKTFDEQTNIFKDEKGKLQKWLGETVFGDPYCEEIVNHSKNIIDLIEVGDIITFGVETIFIQVFEDKENLDYFKELHKDEQDTLKSIVTKEMMESVEYKIGG